MENSSACLLTPGNVDDRRPVPQLAQDLFGKLIGDKGYLSQALVETLWQQGVELLTPLRRTMKQRLVRLTNKLLVRKWVVIETITDHLKTLSLVEQSLHRSPANSLIHVVCALIASCHQPKKPALPIPDAVVARQGHYLTRTDARVQPQYGKKWRSHTIDISGEVMKARQRLVG